MRVAILNPSEPQNTGHYFIRAAQAGGDNPFIVRTEEDALRLQPDDLLLAVDPFYSPWPQWIGDLRCKTAAYLIDVHQNLQLRVAAGRFFDHVFTAQKDYLPLIDHPNKAWLPLAGDPEVHHQSAASRDLDVGFVGKLGPEGSARRATLLHILGQFETNDFSVSYSPREMGIIYSSSKIVINKSINGDLNMRAFEAWASGALLVTDRICNGLAEIATEGVHYIGYDSDAEALDVIHRYLSDEVSRVRIAAAGQAHLNANHTYVHRWQALKQAIAKDPGALAPVRAQSKAAAHRWNSELLALTGAPLPDVLRLLGRPGLNPRSLWNAAVATVRFASRSVRQ